MQNLQSGNWKNRKLIDHVENRSCYTLKHLELNLFETHQISQMVALQFPDPVMASMLKGKKVMYLNQTPSFDFLPGESVFMKSDTLMEIDFPEANINNPTQCLALRFDYDRLKYIIEEINLLIPRIDEQYWVKKDNSFVFNNDIAVNQIIQRLIYLFTENHPSKDFFGDMMIKELMIRILQFENQKHYIEKAFESPNSSRFSFVIDFICKNLNEKLSITELSKKAGMSESAFYKAFKEELGITPNEFIINERLRVVESLLKNPNISIKEAYLSSGFNSFQYFCRIFKKKNRMQPSTYREKNLKM